MRVLAHEARDERAVAGAALAEDGTRVDRAAVPAREVVEHDDRLPAVEELLDERAADVAGAAGDEDRHVSRDLPGDAVSAAQAVRPLSAAPRAWSWFSRNQRYDDSMPSRSADAVAPAERVQPRRRRAACAACRRASSRRTRARAAGWTIVAHHLGQLADRQVLAGADVDVLRRVVVAHQEQAGVGEVVDVQELAARASRCPRRRPRGCPRPSRRGTCGSSAGSTCERVEVEVVVRAVEVRRHRRDEVAAVLPAVRLAELDAGDLRDRVRLVRRLEQAREQVLLLHRLRALARVDARAAEVEQPLHREQVRGVHHRGVDHHVVVDELRRPRRVREDAADRAGDEEHVLGPVRAEPVVDGRLVAQVELLARRGEHVAEALGLEPAHDGRADQAAVAGHEDARVGGELSMTGPC